MAERPLLLQLESPVATIVFNRPGARNALNDDMQRALPPMLERLHQDASIRVFVLRGAGGKAFAAGDDITQFVHWGAEEALAHYHHLEAFIGAIEAFPKPTIALIQGFAVGAGLEVAAACDVRYASADSRFGIPIARLGHTVDLHNALRLIRLVGPARVKELLFTAELIGAGLATLLGEVARALSQRIDDVLLGVCGGGGDTLLERRNPAVDRLLERLRPIPGLRVRLGAVEGAGGPIGGFGGIHGVLLRNRTRRPFSAAA